MDQAAKLVTTIARIPGPKEPPPANPESKGPDRPGRVSPGTTAGGLMRGTLGKAHTSSAGARTNQSGEDPGVSGNGDGPHDGGPSDEA
jgi:hypothetical protein